MLKLEIFVDEYLLMPESGMLQVDHHSINQQILSNLKQNQQYNLPHLERLRNDNIFLFCIISYGS